MKLMDKVASATVNIFKWHTFEDLGNALSWTDWLVVAAIAEV